MKRRSKRAPVRIVILLLAALAVCYVAVQAFIVLHNPYETVLAEKSVMSDSVSCRGAMALTETDVMYDGGGVLNYLLGNGARVSAGTVVAQQFAAHDQAWISMYRARIDEKLAMLDKTDVTAEATDVSLLYKQMRSDANDILAILESGELSQLSQARDTLELAANKAQRASGDADFSARVQELQMQKETLTAEPIQQITAPTAGYFVAADESTKRLYTTEQLRAMTPSELQEAVAQESPENDAIVAGKVIGDYQWTFFACVSASAEKFVDGASVTLSFSDSEEDSYPAVITGVEADAETGLVKVELSCDYTSGVVLGLEHADAVITFKTYEGIRIPKSAIRIVDDQRGVYVRTGNIARFCAVTPIYENNTEILVPLTPEEGVNEVRLYDSIVLSGRDLYDGKIIS